MTKKIIVLVAAVVLLSGCSSKGKETLKKENTEAIPVRVMKLSKEKIETTLNYTATLEADKQVYYAPASAGRISKIYVEVGNHVRKGQLLVEMDPTTLNQASTQLKNLETEYNRAVKLNETGSISKQAYDAAVTNYEVAKNNIAFLKENTRMLAPFDGIVSGRYFESGELYTGMAAGGAAKPSILSIEKINVLKANVDLSEQYFRSVKEGTTVELKTELYSGKTFQGKVNIVYPTINASSRTFTVEVLIPNPGETLRPGMYGTIDFFIGETEALVAPSLAILKLQGANNRYAFINKDGVAKRVDINLEKRFDDRVVISGAEVHEGDELVITGQARLVDGSKLSIVK